MTSKLSDYGWKLGLFIALILPLLYVLRLTVLFSGINQQSQFAQLVFGAMELIPSVALALGLGVVICLLVRIEAHLRERSNRD